MNALTLWVAVVLGCAVCMAGGALAFPRFVPHALPTRWVWIRSIVLVILTPLVGVGIGALAEWGSLRRIDEDSQLAVAKVSHDLLERAMAASTGIGDITATGFVAVLAGLILGYQQRSVRLLVAPPFVYWLALQAQRFVDGVDTRPGPDPEFSIGAVGAYPSGGTMRDVVVLGLIAVALAQFWSSRREVAGIGAVWGLLFGLEMVSRAVLGRHWPLDLFGGLVMGLLLLAAGAPLLALRRRNEEVAPATPAASASRDERLQQLPEAERGIRA